ncbi:dihydrodipicolinate reductase [Methanosalsum zhilinae DSM 4017]|uniref:4-hydroxy-tetrahydrodipicolinate reductase n=1 Tax=Methanosalsum zhilinae (strain DSM 4017 / NBRC 107636 / OCM 62 / WeN5) TaxID=679901 RepID=F7XNZ4_METZD|nr:4-hydroxy-tetrahydrodipicolinate reductase [Methanosalsum zhilinae]AEH60184.1 dihydrodipicolinate reductase [Methanosalsum zhilinae DSM 4017]
MIKVAVTGASGRMGGLIIGNIINSDNLELSAAFDISNIGMDAGEVAHAKAQGVKISPAEDMKDVLISSGTDVLIDFTIADATFENAPIAAECGVNMVIGTTGFTSQQRDVIDASIRDNNVAAVISPNYAVGVNVFFRIVKEAAKYLTDYDVEIIEAHHNQKKDAPSGTAMGTAEVINEVMNNREYVFGRQGHAPRGKEIGIHAVRGGDIVGDHTVLFAGAGERIEIKHQAHSRQAFAAGAVKAAEWVSSVNPGIYGMDDILGF